MRYGAQKERYVTDKIEGIGHDCNNRELVFHIDESTTLQGGGHCRYNQVIRAPGDGVPRTDGVTRDSGHGVCGGTVIAVHIEGNPSN